MNTNEIIEMLIDANIYVYRLNDGSQIIAEEIESDDYTVVVTFPAIVQGSYDAFSLNVWNIFQSIENTEISANQIVSKSEAQLAIRAHYYNFYIANTVYAEDTSNNITKASELLELFLDDTDAVDNLDSSKYSKRWDWDPNLN